VRITAQFLDAAKDVAIWTDRFDRDLSDIFALQDEISEAVVKALKLTLLPIQNKGSERRETENGEAYELFLLARQFERTGSERMKPLIVRLCERAVELDPDFARAWALMAQTKAELVQRTIEGYSIEDARQDAERAVGLAPNLPESHAALAEVFLRLADFDGATGPTEAALALDPNCFEANVCAGYTAISRRAFDDSIRYFEKAIELDPDAYRPAGMVNQAYKAIGNVEATRRSDLRCLQTCERILQREPDHGGALGFLVGALMSLGEIERARVLTRRAEILDPDNTRLLYNLACAMAEADPDLACDLLSKAALRVNEGWYNWMGFDNDLDPLRELPRFRAIMEAIGQRLANC